MDLRCAAVLQAAPQLDWARCWHKPVSLVGGGCWLGVRLAHDLLGAGLPEVSRWIQAEAAVPWLAAQVWARLFASGRPPQDHPAFYLGLRERVRDRLPAICAWSTTCSRQS